MRATMQRVSASLVGRRRIKHPRARNARIDMYGVRIVSYDVDETIFRWIYNGAELLKYARAWRSRGERKIMTGKPWSVYRRAYAASKYRRLIGFIAYRPRVPRRGHRVFDPPRTADGVAVLPTRILPRTPQ